MTKSDIIRLVNLWLDVVSDASRDAGWHGDSLFAKFAEYGIVPRGSQGKDQSNTTSIMAIRFLRDPPAEFHVIDRAIREAMKAHYPKIVAVLARHYYCGACPKTSEGDTPDKLRPYTNADRAAAIGQSLRTFERNLSSGYDLLLDTLAGI